MGQIHRNRLGAALVAAALLAPFVLIARFGINTLQYDEFRLVDFVRAVREGGDWLPWLWTQHNEHRVIAMKLVMIPNALFLHWNRVAEMYVSACLCSLIVLGLWRLYRRSGGSDLLLFAPLAWLACSLAQYENLLYGMLTCHYFTVLGIVWALVCLDRPGFGGFVAAVFFGLLASFSILNGLLVWPLGLFVLAARGRRPAVSAAWALTGIAAVALYLVGFQTAVDLRPPLDLSPAGLAKTGLYGLVVLGAPLAGGSVAWGCTVGILLVAWTAATVSGWWRGGRERLREEALPAALLLFGLLSSAMIALGRSGMPVPALKSRYIAYSTLAVIGGYLLACAGLWRRGERPAASPRFAPVLLLLAAGLAAANLDGFDKARDWTPHNLRKKYLLQTFDDQTDQALTGHWPDVSEVRRLAPYLRAERLGPFADPQDVLLLTRWQEGVPLGEILPGRTVEQTLVCPVGDLYEVAVPFVTYGRDNTAQVLLTVETGGRRLGARAVATAGLADSAWIQVPLDEPLRGCQGREIRIRAESADATPGNAVTIWAYPPYYEGTLRQGGSPVPDRALGLALNGYHTGLL
jgi:hypothetical protein